MNIIKKIFYLLGNQYHECKLCNGKDIELKGFRENSIVEWGFVSNGAGVIYIQCPACHGTKIIWG